MPRRSIRACNVPRCPFLTSHTSGKCDLHLGEVRRASDAKRETSAERGYGTRWQRTRKRYIAKYPFCALCFAPSEVPDHWPVTRRELVRRGDPDPDGDQHLRPLCIRCHNRETARAARGSGR